MESFRRDRHPIGVVSIYDDQPFPGVIGTSCLDRGLCRRDPFGVLCWIVSREIIPGVWHSFRMPVCWWVGALCRSSAPPDLSDSSDKTAPLRDRQARHPGRGARCLARVSRRGASPDEDPGIARCGEISTTPPGCRTDCLTGKCDALSGSYTIYASSIPGVIGTSCLDTRAKSRRSLRGSAPPGSADGVSPIQVST